MDIRPDRSDLRRTERTRPAGDDTRRVRSEGERPAVERLEKATQEARIQAARTKSARKEGLEADRVDLSEGAREADRLTEGGTAPDRLAALRELYASGRLNTPERIQAAAAKILGKPTPPDVG